MATKTQPKSVDEYLARLPEDRREALEAVRATILKNLPKGFEEGIQYGMIGYYVPHTLYPAGYHCDPLQPLPFAQIASQKNHMSIYMMCIYSDEQHLAWFKDAWQKTGKRLDMGKGCIRFKKLEDLPLKIVGQAIKKVPVKKFIEHYETAIQGAGKRRRTSSKTASSETRSAGKKAIK